MGISSHLEGLMDSFQDENSIAVNGKLYIPFKKPNRTLLLISCCFFFFWQTVTAIFSPALFSSLAFPLLCQLHLESSVFCLFWIRNKWQKMLVQEEYRWGIHMSSACKSKSTGMCHRHSLYGHWGLNGKRSPTAEKFRKKCFMEDVYFELHLQKHFAFYICFINCKCPLISLRECWWIFRKKKWKLSAHCFQVNFLVYI